MEIRWSPLSAQELRGREFKPARTADLEDIVLKAQLTDGSVRCRASAEGLILLLIDEDLVWSRQIDPEDPDAARWLEAARTRDVTILSGAFQTGKVADRHSANDGPLLIAKVPTELTR